MNNLIKQFLHLDSASISDALDSFKISGGLPGIKALFPKTTCVGFAYTVKYEPIKGLKEFQNAGNYIDRVPENSIIVIDNGGRTDCTTWGNILTEVALQKKIRGTVIHGCARDISEIREKKYPLFATSTFMQSAKNRARKVAENNPIYIGNVKIEPGDIIFCDENGCLAIPSNLASEIAQRAMNVLNTENKIIQAIQSGMQLEDARKLYGYSKPWEMAI